VSGLHVQMLAGPYCTPFRGGVRAGFQNLDFSKAREQDFGQTGGKKLDAGSVRTVEWKDRWGRSRWREDVRYSLCVE